MFDDEDFRIGRADAVLRPRDAEAKRAALDARRRERDKRLHDVAERLFESDDFCEWVQLAMERINYFAATVREMSPYEQGKRNGVAELIEQTIANGGIAAQNFYADQAERYAEYRQKQAERNYSK